MNANLKKFPALSKTEFRDYLHGRARAVQSVALYLAQHIDFEADDAMENVERLAANTLGYHLAEDDLKSKIVDLFQATAESLMANTDAAARLLIRKSPLPPADLKKLSDWLQQTTEKLISSDAAELLALVAAQALPLANAKSLSSVSEPTLILSMLDAWITGQSFADIQKILVNAQAKVGGDHPTAEHTVAICEDGFGYHLAMILASIVDLIEPIDVDLATRVTSLQRKVKSGLGSSSAIAFYEAGFSDRIVAQQLGKAFPKVAVRSDVRSVCRKQVDQVAKVLTQYPAYFEEVAREMRS